MRKMCLLLAGLCAALTGTAQTDTTKKSSEADTIRVGNIIIIKKGGKQAGESKELTIKKKRHFRSANITTNWWVVDLGFNNYKDATNYAGSETQQFAPGANKEWFDLRNGKSVNVNIWLFMQRLNLIKHVVNLKYGLGIELYNFRYESNILYKKTPARIIDTTLHFRKNKLATDYVTVPVMLNFNLTPNRGNNRSFGFSAGVSGSYLYSSRQKYITSETGKEKTKGNLGLEPFKLAYIGELQLGPIKLYGSYASKSMFKEGLDQTPYAVGLRLSNW